LEISKCDQLVRALLPKHTLTPGFR